MGRENIPIMEDYIKELRRNTWWTATGAIVGLVALVISLIALLK